MAEIQGKKVQLPVKGNTEIINLVNVMLERLTVLFGSSGGRRIRS